MLPFSDAADGGLYIRIYTRMRSYMGSPEGLVLIIFGVCSSSIMFLTLKELGCI